MSLRTNCAASGSAQCLFAAPIRHRRYTHNPYTQNSKGPVIEKTNAISAPEENAREVPERSAIIVPGGVLAALQSAYGRQMLTEALRLYGEDAARTIADEIKSKLNVIALDPHGCQVVRALFEVLSTDRAVALALCLLPKTVIGLAVGSQNTRRVLQVIFERHKSEALTPIVSIIAEHSHVLAVEKQGCIAVIRVVQNALPEQRQAIISALIPVLPILAMNCYGNYAVQCVLQHMSHYDIISVVCNAFAGHWVALSRNKFASNVVEKVVWQVDGIARRALVAELVLDTQNLKCLLKDEFGNFVLQTIIQSSKNANEFAEISSRVQPLLQTSPYGNKIERKLCGSHFQSSRVTSTEGKGDVAYLPKLPMWKQ